jgi:hypothetical protein
MNIFFSRGPAVHLCCVSPYSPSSSSPPPTPSSWSLLLPSLCFPSRPPFKDRMFSRISVALHGQNFWTVSDIERLVMVALKNPRMRFAHLHSSWRFEEIRAHLNLDFFRFRNVHDIEFVRDDDIGIKCRFKQWISDREWSTWRTLVKSCDMPALSLIRPTPVPHVFHEADAMLAWMTRLETTIHSSMELTDEVCENIRWFRNVVRFQEVGPKHSMEELLSQLLHSSAVAVAPPTSLITEGSAFPPDLLATQFPGHDTHLPLEALMTIRGASSGGEPERAFCWIGSLVVTGPSEGQDIPLNLGRLVAFAGEAQPPAQAIVQWFFPTVQASAPLRPGKKRHIYDIFAKWAPCDDQAVASVSALPSPFVNATSILAFDFTLEDGQIPFSVFDTIMDRGLDVSGLSVSSTERGNAYRVHRLLSSLAR